MLVAPQAPAAGNPPILAGATPQKSPFTCRRILALAFIGLSLACVSFIAVLFLGGDIGSILILAVIEFILASAAVALYLIIRFLRPVM